MELILDRKWCKDTYSIGRLYIDGQFFSNTLEDKDRGLTQSMSEADVKKIKVYGETAIPKGKYNVVINYSNKFKRLMPYIMNVKGFEGIRIHEGSTAKDSLGCILVGNNTAVGRISNSKSTYTKLYSKLKTAFNKGEKITLTIK